MMEQANGLSGVPFGKQPGVPLGGQAVPPSGEGPGQGFTLSLTPEEAKALLRLLDDHLYYGWVEMQGEFDVVASGEVHPLLRGLYYRVKGFFPRPRQEKEEAPQQKKAKVKKSVYRRRR